MDTAHTPSPTQDDLSAIMQDMGKRARAATKALSLAPPDQRTAALARMAELIRANTGPILEANASDMEAAREKDISPALLDRLELSMARVENMASGLDAIAALQDPIGQEIARWQVPSGLDIARVRTPLGVIGIIYESRPNVTADAGALCIRSGNACILRGGSESTHSSGACLLYTSPSPRDLSTSRMPSSA